MKSLSRSILLASLASLVSLASAGSAFAHTGGTEDTHGAHESVDPGADIADRAPTAANDEPSADALDGAALTSEAQTTSETPFADQPAGALTDRDRALLDETIADLQRRSRRLRAGAITADVIGGVMTTFGISMIAEGKCAGGLFGRSESGRYLCDPVSEGDPYSLSLAAISGVATTGVFLAATLSTAIPLHRVANAHRRAARELEANPELFHTWNLDLHRAALQKRAGRNYLIGAGAMAALSLTGALMIPATDNQDRKSTRASIAGISAVSAAVFVIPGTTLLLNGKRLERRGETHAVTAMITPSFYNDGAGVSLWMGF